MEKRIHRSNPLPGFINYLLLIVLSVNVSCAPGNLKIESTPSTANTPEKAANLEGRISATEIAPTIDPEDHFGVIHVPSQVDVMIGNLSNIPLETFYERSFLYWLSREPELITMLGMSDYFENKNDQLTNISERYVQETEKLEKAILNLLETYNISLLSNEEQLVFELYHWFWKDRVDGQAFRLYQFPVQSYPPASVPDQIINLMINFHPLKNEQDFRDYISRIGLIDVKIDQVIQQMKIREEMGIIPARIIISSALARMQSYLPDKISDHYRVEESIIYQHFFDMLVENDLFDQSQKEMYLNQLVEELDNSFIPAFASLSAYLRELFEKADDQIGIFEYENGDAYYRYLIHHYTSENYTPEQLVSFAEEKIKKYSDQLERISSVNRFDIQALNAENILLAKENANQYIQIYPQFPNQQHMEIITNAQDQAISKISSIISIPGGILDTGFLDAQIDNMLTINPFEMNDPWYALSFDQINQKQRIDSSTIFTFVSTGILRDIIQYHSNEQQVKSPIFRKSLQFPGYFEKWQSYYFDHIAEQTSLESQWEMYSLNQQNLFLSSCLLVDTGIHVYGWTLGESTAFIEKTNGLPKGSSQQTVERIIQNPGQMAIYGMGEYQIKNLMTYVEEQLKENYDQKHFNNWMIEKGSLPFALMKIQGFGYVNQIKKIDANNIIP